MEQNKDITRFQQMPVPSNIQAHDVVSLELRVNNRNTWMTQGLAVLEG